MTVQQQHIYESVLEKKKHITTSGLKTRRQKIHKKEITHPQSHRRRGWSLGSWCAAHAVDGQRLER